MAILPDHILKDIGPSLVDPFNPDMVQPASIDVHIDRYFFAATNHHTIAPSVPNDNLFGELIDILPGRRLVMEPGDFVLASTYEKITVPPNLVSRFEGKSSLARLGLLTHITAGFIDPGFEGHITLELSNVTRGLWCIEPGMKIGQICFEELTSEVDIPYGSSAIGSHYQGQRGPTLSRSHLNYTKLNVYGNESNDDQERGRGPGISGV